MITGNVSSYKNYGMSDEELMGYLEILKGFSKDEPVGMIRLDGDAYCSVQELDLIDDEDRPFEAHRRLIDIQYVLDGQERIDYAELDTLTETVPYSDVRDVAFYKGQGMPIILNSGDFAVFTPIDAHRPCIGTGRVKKIVVKVPVK